MRYLLLAALVVAAAPLAAAHQLVPNDGSHTEAASALEVPDVSISQVIYHEIAEPGGQLWVTFLAEEGQNIYLQLGVPRIDRLESYRPVLWLFGPGLPPAETLPGVPENYGGLLLEPDAVPEEFNEPFTGTQSWILLEEDTAAPAAGQYYVVAYHPEGVTGKLWLAWGRREVFGFRDLLTYPDVLDTVRTFHEVADQRLPFLPRVLRAVSRISRLFTRIFGIPY